MAPLSTQSDPVPLETCTYFPSCVYEEHDGGREKGVTKEKREEDDGERKKGKWRREKKVNNEGEERNVMKDERE